MITAAAGALAATASPGAALAASAADAATAAPAAPHVYNAHLRPVARIASTRMAIDTPAGPAQFPLYLSRDWNQPQPGVTRAVIVIHGKLRNADRYFHSAEQGRDAAAAQGAQVDGTLLIAPQFLASLDLAGRDGDAALLRWDANGWMAGDEALAPAALSSYAVLDAIVERLADRTRFPNLKAVVFAGHSGGGQVVQRYAVAARETGVLARDGIALRYVVSSPSSYAYFDAERPGADGKPAAFDAAACPGFDDWKYGMAKRPPYLADRSAAQLEAAYAARQVTYLVGGNDDDPRQKALDQSCPAEAQGPQRLARAQAYFGYLQARHPQGLNQQLHVVPGVGHNGAKMLTSACALAAIYDTPGCGS
ncbi:alpha/beta hydrolase [Burkholderia sp. Ac-20379]|uniref:alpha/beta hydrolase n=1 Tax=Burkholderia sp. Ac-20379 TaxID=2703900 RepID=UPI00197E9A4A|nr:alpha/beta hydrolase [Burkholderia sp. Ac-20379]MBN3727171.1 alpha/beta hydrolase [Burkholderia sp. Ac-20379]